MDQRLHAIYTIQRSVTLGRDDHFVCIAFVRCSSSESKVTAQSTLESKLSEYMMEDADEYRAFSLQVNDKSFGKSMCSRANF